MKKKSKYENAKKCARWILWCTYKIGFDRSFVIEEIKETTTHDHRHTKQRHVIWLNAFQFYHSYAHSITPLARPKSRRQFFHYVFLGRLAFFFSLFIKFLSVLFRLDLRQVIEFIYYFPIYFFFFLIVENYYLIPKP